MKKQLFPDQYNCSSCNLDKQCKSPRMEGFGAFQKDIMILGESPGRMEDKKGIPFVGESGDLLYDIIEGLNWSFNRDFFRTNVIQCRPPDNKLGTDKEKKLRMICCKSRWEKEI